MSKRNLRAITFTSVFILFILFDNTNAQIFDPPITISDITDGTAHDIASGIETIFLAQGRNLSLIDPSTGKRTENGFDSPYPSSVKCVEYLKSTETLALTTRNQVYIYKPDNPAMVWDYDTNTEIMDLKFVPNSKKIIISSLDQFVILDYSGESIVKNSELSIPEDISFFYRIFNVIETSNGTMAYLSGSLKDASKRGMHAMIIANLDIENDAKNPMTYPIWDPVSYYKSVKAAVNYVQVLEGYNGDKTFAFVACGEQGQLTILDVTDPSNILYESKLELSPGFSVFKTLLSGDKTKLYVASSNILHSVDINTLELIDKVNTGFYDAGDHDMALYSNNEKEYVWTATHYSVDYVLHCVDVTNEKLIKEVKSWWISSSDGAVAVPEWNSVYLPTFGGLVRYDISDEKNPIAVDDSYQPAKGTIEHIDIIFPNPENKNSALLLTAPGNGGVQYWPISKGNPNPGEPSKIVEFPQGWEGNPVYQNDVTFFQKDGINYFLSDLANRKTDEIALQIFNTQDRSWINVIEGSPDLTSNSKNIVVSGNFALVSCQGGFFIVDLSGLPESVEIVAEVVNDWNNDSIADDTDAICLSPDGRYIFIAADPGVVQSYEFNQETNEVTGPLCILIGDTISGSTAKSRYYDAIDRFYIAGRGGNIMEIDAQDPHNLILRSVWNNGNYTGEMQDCRIYDFGNGPRMLAVKNNQCFAILDLDDEDNAVEELNCNPLKFNIYPNPAFCSIKISREFSLNSKYEIVDINGNILLEGDLPGSASIDISAFQTGTYFIKIILSEKIINSKFYKY